MDTCSDSVHVVEHRLRHRLCISCGHPHRSQSGIRVRCAACGWRYQRHINGIEGLWSDAKEHFRKYHGVSRQYFPLYL